MFSLSILAVVLCYTWLLAPVTPRSMSAVAALLVVALAVVRAVKTGEWGLKSGGFLPALAWTTLFTIAAAIAIYVAGSALGTRHGHPNPWSVLAVLVAWGLGQQFALQTVFLREAQALTSRRAGILLAAVMFAALHLPNPFLTLMTGVAAVAWCSIYDRYPNVLPLALSHAVLTFVVLYAFDDAMTGRLRVGVAYLNLR